MKNWSEDLPGMKCPWAEDLADAKRVAVQLNLDFEVWDFETEYKSKVVDYMLAEFQKGRTPNPDVMCNELIKFKLFLRMGSRPRRRLYRHRTHYARVGAVEVGDKAEHDRSTEHEDLTRAVQSVSEDCAASSSAPDLLLKAVDANKDQTYFLYRMSDAATAKTLFPIGALKNLKSNRLPKTTVSMSPPKGKHGHLFRRRSRYERLLQQYLDAQPGEIREQETGTVLGYHDGAIFYTIGQRQYSISAAVCPIMSLARTSRKTSFSSLKTSTTLLSGPPSSNSTSSISAPVALLKISLHSIKIQLPLTQQTLILPKLRLQSQSHLAPPSPPPPPRPAHRRRNRRRPKHLRPPFLPASQTPCPEASPPSSTQVTSVSAAASLYTE